MENKLREIKTFVLYFFVGGSSAIVEWLVFWLTISSIHFLIATIISFVLATYVNYMLGVKLVFNNYKKESSDFQKVFLVSGCGLFINLILMVIFVEVLQLDSAIAKILSTGIVFSWNYISRRIFIYRSNF